jgi:type VI protein secretion system component Hcp
MIQIFGRKTQDGKTIVIDCDENDTIEEIRTLVSNKTGVPMDYVRLTLRGKILQDRATLEDYNITKETTIDITYKPITWSINSSLQ